MKVTFFLLVAFSLVTKSVGFVVERPDGIGIDLEVDDEVGGENEDVSDFLVDSNVDTSGDLGFIYLFIYLFIYFCFHHDLPPAPEKTNVVVTN